MTRFVTLAMIGATLLGCSGPVSPNELRELQQAQARWAARSFSNYVVEMRLECFCDPRVTQWNRIEVKNGVVMRVTPLASGEDIPDGELSGFRTVDQVFESIIRAVDGSDWLGDAELAFDETLGYPTTARLIAKKNIADADVSYYLRNVSALP
jgi:hypothetical protein